MLAKELLFSCPAGCAAVGSHHTALLQHVWGHGIWAASSCGSLSSPSLALCGLKSKEGGEKGLRPSHGLMTSFFGFFLYFFFNFFLFSLTFQISGRLKCLLQGSILPISHISYHWQLPKTWLGHTTSCGKLDQPKCSWKILIWILNCDYQVEGRRAIHSFCLKVIAQAAFEVQLFQGPYTTQICLCLCCKV